MNHFVATMPAVYERLYTPGEVAEHAAIASRRGTRPVHAELWRSATGPMLCVVADDRPGLLALVTDALLAQGMAIQNARAFCRQVGKDRSEAVDFLELRALGGPGDVAAQLDSDGLQSFAQALSELIASDMAQRSAASASSVPRHPNEKTRVYFERQSPADGRYLLVVDAPDSNGLLHAVSSALDDMGLRIMACDIRTVGGRTRDRFEVEPASERGSTTASCATSSLPSSTPCRRGADSLLRGYRESLRTRLIGQAA